MGQTASSGHGILGRIRERSQDTNPCDNHHILPHSIIEHNFKIGMPIVEIMRILGKWALTNDDICELLNPLKTQPKEINDRQLYFDFKFD